MGLKTPEGTDVYCATRSGVALQQFGDYRLTRAHARKAQTGKACSATDDGVSPCRPPSVDVTILKHCRCIDCRKFSKVEGEYCCRDGIGGTKVVWGTGERICDPPPEAWHYCAGYHGPQISRDVWVWPKGSHKVYLPKPWRRQAAQVGAGVNVASNPANLATDAKERNGGDQSEER